MNKSMKVRVIRLVVGALLWALPLEHFPGLAQITFYPNLIKMAAAYLIIVYDVIWEAISNV